ncbi:hypothetical protein SODALDRAFT_380799, partial [Sodiomyces alkalinus F11]
MGKMGEGDDITWGRIVLIFFSFSFSYFPPSFLLLAYSSESSRIRYQESRGGMFRSHMARLGETL